MNKKILFLATLMSMSTIYGGLSYSNTKPGISRVYGSDRYETSIKISKENFSNSEYVVIVSGEKFSDSVSAIPLASYLNAPILLFDKNGENERIKQEINRLGANNAIIVGGENSINIEFEKNLSKNMKVERISSSDRYETSVEVAKKMYSMGNKFNTLIIANGSKEADLLSLSGLASKNKQPVVLVRKNEEPKGAYGINGYSKIRKIVVGGKESVDIQNLDGHRIFGEDRFKTSIAVANFAFGENVKSVVVSSSDKYSDAVGSALISGKYNIPILLTKKDILNEDSKEYIDKNKIESIIVVGGRQTISEDVYEKMEKIIGVKKDISSSSNAVNNYKNSGISQNDDVYVYPNGKDKLIFSRVGESMNKYSVYAIDSKGKISIEDTKNGIINYMKKLDVDSDNIFYVLDGNPDLNDEKIKFVIVTGDNQRNLSLKKYIGKNISGVFYSHEGNIISKKKEGYDNRIIFISGEVNEASPIPVDSMILGMPDNNRIKNGLTISNETRVVEGLNFDVSNSRNEQVPNNSVIENRGSVKDKNKNLSILNNKFDFGEGSKFVTKGISVYGASEGYLEIIKNEFKGINSGESIGRKLTESGAIRIIERSSPETVVKVSNNKIRKSEYHGIAIMHGTDSALEVIGNEIEETGSNGITISVFGNPKNIDIKNNAVKKYGTAAMFSGGAYGTPKTETNSFEKGIELAYIESVYGVKVNEKWYEDIEKLTNDLRDKNLVSDSKLNNTYEHVLDSADIDVGRTYTFKKSSESINKDRNLDKKDITIVKDEDGNVVYGRNDSNPEKHVVVANLRIVGNGEGEIYLPSTLDIKGDLIIETPNAVVKNLSSVGGKTIIKSKSIDKSKVDVDGDIEIFRKNSERETIGLRNFVNSEGKSIASNNTDLSEMEIYYVNRGNKINLEKGRDFTVEESSDNIIFSKSFLNSLNDDTTLIVSLEDTKNKITNIQANILIKIKDATTGKISIVDGEETSYYYKNANKDLRIKITDVHDMSGRLVEKSDTHLSGNIKISSTLVKHSDDYIDIDDENDIITIKKDFLNKISATQYSSNNKQVGFRSSGEVKISFSDYEHGIGDINGKVALSVINDSSARVEVRSSTTFVENNAPKNGISFSVSDIRDSKGEKVDIEDIDFENSISIIPFPFDWKNEVSPSGKIEFRRDLYDVDSDNGIITLKKEYLDKLVASADVNTEDGVKSYQFMITDDSHGINYLSDKFKINIKKKEKELDSDASIMSVGDKLNVSENTIESNSMLLGADTTVDELIKALKGNNPRLLLRVYPSKFVNGDAVDIKNKNKYKKHYQNIENGDKLVSTAEDGKTKRVYTIKFSSQKKSLLIGVKDNSEVVKAYGNTFIDLDKDNIVSKLIEDLNLEEGAIAQVIRGESILEDNEKILSNDVLKITKDNIIESRKINVLGTPVYRALIVANSDYPGERFDLVGPKNDVGLMKTVFDKNVFEGNSRFSKVVSKENQTKQGFLEALKETFNGAKENDVSYIYYSGHGNNIDGESFICTVDDFSYTENEDDNKENAKRSWISVKELHDALDSIPGTKVIIFDSCNSGGFIGKEAVDAITSPSINRYHEDEDIDNTRKMSAIKIDENHNAQLITFNENIAREFNSDSSNSADGSYLVGNRYKVLAASSSNEYSYEDIKKGYGKFTKALHDGMIESEGFLPVDEDKNNKVSLEELYEYLTNNVDYTSHIQAYPRKDDYTIFEVNKGSNNDEIEEYNFEISSSKSGKINNLGIKLIKNAEEKVIGGEISSSIKKITSNMTVGELLGYLVKGDERQNIYVVPNGVSVEIPNSKQVSQNISKGDRLVVEWSDGKKILYSIVVNEDGNSPSDPSIPNFGGKYSVDKNKRKISSGTIKLTSKTTKSEFLSHLIVPDGFGYRMDRDYDDIESEDFLVDGDAIMMYSKSGAGSFPKKFIIDVEEDDESGHIIDDNSNLEDID